MTGMSGTAWWIAWRYLTTRRRHFAAFVTRISVIGLLLGVLVLTVVVSVMNGFDAELKRRILGTVPHVLVEGVSAQDPAIIALQQDPAVIDAFDLFTGDAMITARGLVNPVQVYGLEVATGAGLAMVADNMVEGAFADLFGLPNGLLMGAPLAAQLGLRPGDSVTLILSDPRPAGVEPRILRFHLAGLFEVGADPDYALVIVPMEALRHAGLLRLGSTGVRLTIADPMQAPGFASDLQRAHADWAVSSWADEYGDLFRAVRMEKVMMFLILLMVVAVAAFNIVAGQTMAVTEKQSDIAILRTMGAPTGILLRVFLLQGVVIASFGIVVGLALGIVVALHVGGLVAALESWTGFRMLEGTYFVEIPSVVQPLDLVAIGAISWSLCLLSAWLPARRAAAINPLAGLHQ